MRKRLVCLVLLSVTIAATALYDSGRALATEAEGYNSTLLALGHFREVEVTHTFTRDQKASEPGSHCNRHRDCQTCTCKAMFGRPGEAPAGIRTPGIA